MSPALWSWPSCGTNPRKPFCCGAIGGRRDAQRGRIAKSVRRQTVGTHLLASRHCLLLKRLRCLYPVAFDRKAAEKNLEPGKIDEALAAFAVRARTEINVVIMAADESG